jgi:hypothetical protein
LGKSMITKMILNKLLSEEASFLWLTKLLEENRSITIIQIKGSIEVIVSRHSEEAILDGNHRCLRETQNWKRHSRGLVLQMTQYLQLKATPPSRATKFQHLKSKRKEWWRMLMVSILRKSNRDREN